MGGISEMIVRLRILVSEVYTFFSRGPNLRFRTFQFSEFRETSQSEFLTRVMALTGNPALS